MVLVGYGRGDNSLRLGKKVEYMVCHADPKFLHYRLLPDVINLLSLRDNNSVIVEAVIPPVHALEESKRGLVLTRFPCSRGAFQKNTGA